MTVPNKSFCLGMHQHQKEQFGAFDYRLKLGIRTSYKIFEEWHRRARKTTGAINLLNKECCRVSKAKYVYVAPTQVMARNIVWDDPNMLRAALPDKREMGWRMNEQKMLVQYDNGSILKLGGSDEPDALRGIDAIGAVFDEWSLHKAMVWTEVFRAIMTGPLHPQFDMIDLFRWSMFLWTPKGINHATSMFDDACMLGEGGSLPACGQADMARKDTYASRLDGELSGILSLEELKKMQEDVERGEIPQAFYDQEIKCSRVTSEEMTLITTELIHQLNSHHRLTEHAPYETRKIVSIDPAWGGDVCKIGGMINNEILPENEETIRDKHRPSEIILAAKKVAQQIHTKNFIVDIINDGGVAIGLADDEAGYNVQFFDSRLKPTEKDSSTNALKFANLRAEAYAYTAKLIRTFEAGPIHSQRLITGLPIASMYKTQGGSGKLIILPKNEIKKGTKNRAGLGHSPDDEDMYIMGNWGLQFVDAESEQPTEYRSQRYRGRVTRPESAMA